MRGYADPDIVDGTAMIERAPVAIDGIRINRLAGTGANGFVFAGFDERLKRSVAVKVWPPRKDGPARPGQQRVNQALAEAAKVSTLKSAHIVSIYAAGQLHTGWPYVVMEYIDDAPLKDVRAELSLWDRRDVWHNVYRALDVAERNGIYHGDLHDGNVLVRWFHATVIDFGTSMLSGHEPSLRRHARLVHQFVQRLLPELDEYVPALDVPDQVRPEYVSYVEHVRVEAAESLMELETDLGDLTVEQVRRRLASLANHTSTALIDLVTPILRWLPSAGIEATQIAEYSKVARAEADRRRAQPWPPTVGLILRPVPPFPEADTVLPGND
jgi:serine/threonine protein kinase